MEPSSILVEEAGDIHASGKTELETFGHCDGGSWEISGILMEKSGKAQAF